MDNFLPYLYGFALPDEGFGAVAVRHSRVFWLRVVAEGQRRSKPGGTFPKFLSHNLYTEYVVHPLGNLAFMQISPNFVRVR